MEYFTQERKQGLYETSWKAWDPAEGSAARSPRVGGIPAMAGCSSTATAQEAVMFLYDQVQSGIFGDAGAYVEERIGEALALATSPSGGGSGWFDFRLSEEALGAEELAKLVLAPEGWPAEKAAIPKGYMMHIVSVGRGVKATLCGRENNHIVNALHRDISKCGQLCDTCLCGVVGRKRVVLFAPDEFHETSGWARKPDLTSHNLHALTHLPEAEAWRKLEELASRPDVAGGALTLEPGRFVFVPHGWWHAVQPVDGFTFITGPSRLSGLAVAQS